MKRPLCMVCLLFCLLWGVLQSRLPKTEFPIMEGEQVRIEGRIYKDEIAQNGVRLYLTDVLLNSNPNHFKDESSKQIQFLQTNIKIFLSNPEEYRVGETVVVTGVMENFKEASNHGEFNQRAYQNMLGIGFQLKKANIVFRSQSVKKSDYYISIFRKRLIEVYDKECKSQAGTMISLLLGQREYMDSNLKELYQRNGIAHILAISGLHISFIGLLLFKIGKKLYLPRMVNFSFALAFVYLYGKMTGMSASTKRAIIMLALLLISQMIGRTYDLLTATSLSFLIVLLMNPGLFFYSGFQLSFACVTALGLELPEVFMRLLSVDKWKKSFQLIGRSFVTSLAITLFTLPILLHSYYAFSTYSVFLNLLIIPLMSFVLFLGLSGGLWGMLCPVGAELMLRPAEWILCMYEWLATVTDHLPHSVWIIGKPSVWQIIGYYIVIVLIKAVFEKYVEQKMIRFRGVNHSTITEKKQIILQYFLRGIVCVSLMLLLLGILIVPIQIERQLKSTVTMLDVGQGECICLQLGGRVYLIDGGSTSESEIAKYKIEPFLKSQGIDRVDAVFISHPDADHINGIVDAVARSRESGIRYEQMILSENVHNYTDEYRELLMAAGQNRCEILIMKCGQYIEKQNRFRIVCLHPSEDMRTDDVNDSSLVLLLECKGKKFLFTGDISSEVEDSVLYELDKYMQQEEGIDVLKVAHHGSKYSTSTKFIESVMPKCAIISCGKWNRYGHPHSETLERLAKIGTIVYCTDELGATEIHLQEGKIEIVGYRKNSSRYVR